MNNSTLSTTQETGRMKVSPTVAAFEQELENILLRFTKKGNPGGDIYSVADNARKRKANFSKLFKEYKPHLQHQYFMEKLIQTGSFLCSVQISASSKITIKRSLRIELTAEPSKKYEAYRMAKFQCFTRYLQEISPDFTSIETVADFSLNEYQETFFAKGLQDVQAIETIKVIYQDIMCSYQLLTECDPKLLNPTSVARCQDLLKLLRLTTRLALHQDSLSWLVYNGTIDMYTISRQLMVTGRSALVVEYLLWACMCMEGLIPLLTVKYLPWRSTLYAAVCLCYLDCKEPQHAETFARRAMKKINELSDIENMSNSVPSSQTKAIFQSAKVKINAIIFQRVIFELRKRPKGLLRPKVRPSLKEVLHQSWPRNQTERLLSDLFEGSAAQFLAILQTLGDPHRRTLQCKAPTGAIDDITLDIYPELFAAGVDLISVGNIGTRGPRHELEVHPSCIELSSMSLLALSEQGSDGVPLPFVVKFIKLAFSYEQWEVLDVLLQPFITMLKTGTDLVQSPAYIMALQLLAAMEPFHNTGRKQRKVVTYSDCAISENAQGTKSSTSAIDDLLVIANILNGSSTDLPQSCLPYVDIDMIIDASLFLWSRCKSFFQRVVSCNLDSCRQVMNDPDCDKWLYLLLTIHNVLHWSSLSDVDPIMTGEVALKLAFILECRASSLSRLNKTPNSLPSTDTKEPSGDQPNSKIEERTGEKPEKTQEAGQSHEELVNKPYQAAFPDNAVELFHMAFNILEASIERVTEVRDKMQRSFEDVKSSDSDKTDLTTSSAITEDNVGELREASSETAIKIVHLELLFNLTRLLIKLDTAGKGMEFTSTQEKPKNSSMAVQKQTKKDQVVEESWTAEVIKKYNKRALTKALLLMHRTQINHINTGAAKQKLQKCLDLIQKAQTQQQVLSSKREESDHPEPSAVPPPPIVVFRSSSKIILKPSPYQPLTNKKVCWYRVFGLSASGSNVKVRFNDSDLVGTAEEVPQGPDCKFCISNLSEGERYVFAVAAYDKEGKLIGDGIGPTGHPVSACYPMPVIMAWGYLAQTAYTCAVHDIAKASCQVLWRYFIPDRDHAPEDSNEQQSFVGQTKLKIGRCDKKLLANSNQALLRQFLQSLFISVDIDVQDGKLYCDSLCDYGPLLLGQIKRLKQCEKVLLALQVALWLNDNALVLQSVTRCYGLLAPLVQLKIPAQPVVQVLLLCHAVLQEIPSLSRFRKHSLIFDSLYHLTAVVTYYLSKVLPLWGEEDLANNVWESGRKLLWIDSPSESNTSVGASQTSGSQASHITNSKSMTKKTTRTKMAGKKTKVGAAKSNIKPEQLTKVSNFLNKEFLSLENYFLKTNKEAILSQKDENELTGIEDPLILAAYIAGMNAQDAYKEVIKFKRRTKYLEYFVQVVEKAFVEECFDKVLEWSVEAEQWLNKRNEIMILAQKQSLVRVHAEFGVEETRPRKYPTAIVEYGKPTAKKAPRSVRQLLETLTETKTASGSKPDHYVPVARATVFISRFRKEKTRGKKGRTPEEQDMLSAIECLQTKLPDFWKTNVRKQKLRSITDEELPWRCQWNILRGMTNLEMFLNTARKHDMSSPASMAQESASLIGTDWFDFDVTSVLIRRNAANGKGTSTSSKTVSSSPFRDNLKANSVRKRGLPRTDATLEYLKYIVNAAKYLSRAVVLSYRGKCWGLLQNASCHLWNLKQKLQSFVLDPASFLTEEMFQEIICIAFYKTADTLLDMVLCIEKDKAETLLSKNKSASVNLSKEVTFWGDIEDEKGGSDLIFEAYLDNQADVDVVWIKRMVMYSMQLLFYQKKWEKLADIILRFNVVTRGRYAESVLPVLAVAQQKLSERAQENGGVSCTQPDVEISPESGKPEGVTITPKNYISIEPAVHIDPKGHDVYNEANDALRLFCVPIDKKHTLQMLRHCVELKHSGARALQHSRQLLSRYLAGLCQQKKGPSRVGFVPFEDKAVTSVPPAVSDQTFDKIDDVQKCPLVSSQLAIVIASYDKTIEMLRFHGQKALLAQAMSEIGNIMHHIGNTRSAFRWWKAALDSILSPVASSKHNQRSQNPYYDAVHVSPALLLRKRGLWGCLLGAITAINIARYIHTDNTDKRLDCCCVAASLLKALFSSSLPHPSACCDFALYDIGNGYPVSDLIPGVNLFSDPFRCDAKVLLASTIWLAEELIETGHYLLVLPILTFARYISSDIFDDETLVIKVLLLRIRALTSAGLFSQSYIILNSLLVGRDTKLLQKNHFDDFRLENEEGFQTSKPVTDKDNLQAINHLISFRMFPDVAISFVNEQARSLALEKARLMIRIASRVYAIPLDVKKQLMVKLAGETAPDITITEQQKVSKSFQVNLFEDNVSESLVKSYLLAGAELLLEELRDKLLGAQKDLRDFLDAKGEHFKPSELKSLILIELELASIRQQYLESLSGAKIVYNCMRALEDASVLLEHDQKRFGLTSAWTAFSRSSDPSKTPEPLCDESSPGNTELGPYLWLACREKMVDCLSCENNSIGRIAGFSRSVVALTGSCEQHHEQGMDEADAFAYTEVLTEFRFAALLLRLQRGCLSQADIEELKNAMDILRNFHPLSVKGRLLLVKMLVYYGDLAASNGYSKEDNGSFYQQAETILREEMEAFGENLGDCTEETFRSVRNIHQPHILLLAETKLRRGRTLSQMIENSSDVTSINEALDVLTRGLWLVRTMRVEQNPLESEFSYLIGALQHLLWVNGQCSEMVVVSSFIDAITKTYNFDHNLELMKDCYEQLASLYLTKIERLKPDLAVEEVKATTNVSIKMTRSNSKLSRKEREAKEKEQEIKANPETKKEIKAAWVAIRAAAMTTAVINACGHLLGDVTQLSISEATGVKIPRSVVHDMLGAVSIIMGPDGESCVKDRGAITMESYINDSNVVQLTWVHLLSHVSYLQGQVSYQSLGVTNVGHGGPLFRWQKLLKLYQVRHFLSTELELYDQNCTGVYPSPLLLLPIASESKDDDNSPCSGKTVDEADEYEISIHWLSTNRFPERTSNETECEKIQCLYTFNNKGVTRVTKTRVFAGRTSVMYETIMEVHEQLRVLLELAETEFAPQVQLKPSRSDIAVSHYSTTAPPTSRKKRSTGIRSLSARGRRDDQVLMNLRECLNSLTGMMKPSLLSDKKVFEIPFEVSYANIRALESMFDPGRGFIGKTPESFYTWLTSLFL